MKNPRKKGKRAELAVAKLLEKWTGFKFNRTPNSGGLRWRKDQRVTGDIVPGPRIKKIFPFSVEVKFNQSYDFSSLLRSPSSNKIIEHFSQSVADGRRCNREPLLVFRSNGMPRDEFYVAMRVPMFLNLVGMYTRPKKPLPVLMASEAGLVIMLWSSFTRPSYMDVFRIVWEESDAMQLGKRERANKAKACDHFPVARR